MVIAKSSIAGFDTTASLPAAMMRMGQCHRYREYESLPSQRNVLRPSCASTGRKWS